jgi:uncharacterized repeat protein (TIGR03803 family)
LVEAPDGYLYGTTAAGGSSSQGTVFRVGFDGTESVLYSFAGGANDGATPSGGLLVGSDGTLYGTTRSGGAGSCGGQQPSGLVLPIGPCGTIFALTLSGQEQVLYLFQGGDDGGVPMTGLVQASSGDLYGTTTGGGNYLDGTVFQFTPLGKQSVLYAFGAAGPNDGASPEAGVVIGTNGSLYGSTALGGASDNGTLFNLTLAGAETVLATFTGAGAGQTPTQTLMQASDGNFYGTSSGGGMSSANCPSGCGTVFQLTPSGTLTILYRFGGNANDGILPSSALIQAGDGNLYGTTRAGGGGSCSAGCGTVFKVTPGGVETVLYSFQGNDDGATPQAALIQATDGALYGTTSAGGQQGEGTAFRVALDGTELVLHSFGNVSTP